ncbi:hypothetical protein N9B82_04630 [Saprospiraceae bacterium]|nr:hypothetical protein [Saprospiraceae bacterium]
MSKTDKKKVVLYSILHWGLGHATRSIPVIKGLQTRGYEVIVCTDGKVVDFIKEEIAGIKVELLPAYNIRYSSSSMVMNMLLQLPKIYSAFILEKVIFKKLVKKYSPTFCISDNRYGCKNKIVPSFFLGHQWNILDSKGNKHKLASKLNQYFISKFQQIIIPDGNNSEFSGKLSKDIPKGFGIYVGILSRFTKTNFFTDHSKYDATIILSGPEPSRTNLEKNIISVLSGEKGKSFILVRGTNRKSESLSAENIEVLNLVNSNQLSDIIDQSACVISRSGYSSIMDYVRLGAKDLIFIPTKGQTEQEYLARYYNDKYSIAKIDEDNLDQLTEQLNKNRKPGLVEGESLGINGLIDKIEKLVSLL